MSKNIFKPKSIFFGMIFIFSSIFLTLFSLYIFIENETITNALFFVFSLLLMIFFGYGITILNPKEGIVIQQFGVPKGYFCTSGLYWVFPWLSITRVFLADCKMESPKIKVNDKNGTPINISASFTVRIVDPENYTYNLGQNLEEYIETTTQGILRNIIKKYPYDSEEKNVNSLIGSGEEISLDIENSINKEASQYGIKVDNLLLSEIAYAPEIASIMLQKQQAQATIDAKSTLINGLVDVVNEVVENICSNDNYEFSKEDKAKFAKDALIVMIANKETVPVLNVSST